MHNLVDQLKSPLICVVGDVMVDHWMAGTQYRTTTEYGLEQAICDIESEELSCGGAANAARNIRSLGGHVEVVGLSSFTGMACVDTVVSK